MIHPVKRVNIFHEIMKIALVGRQCGHPGDTPNGDFELRKETEFVFGATVEYKCRPG